MKKETWQKMTDDETSEYRHILKEIEYLIACLHEFSDKMDKKYSEEEDQHGYKINI